MIVEKPEFFNIRDICECGQIFRFRRIDDMRYVLQSKDHIADIKQTNDELIIDSDNYNYFYEYLDIARDYGKIIDSIKDLPLMREALETCSGVRLLNQDPFETIISFIISANNHIPRIKGIIERISSTFGKNMGEYCAFPTLEQLKDVAFEEYTKLGLGYRDKYIFKTVNLLANKEIDINSLYEKNTSFAKSELLKLQGVGGKVADCILLFAYKKTDVFPVDTWVKKIYKTLCPDSDIDDGKKISKILVDMYGQNAGYAQQYLFYAKRGLR